MGIFTSGSVVYSFLKVTGVPCPDYTEDVRPEAAVVEPLDGLRLQVRDLVVRYDGIRAGEELGAEGNRVEAQDEDAGDQGRTVLPEPPPHELPLGGYEYPLLLDVGGYSLRSAAPGFLRC